MQDITMRQLLEAGVHFGHQTRFWDPKMAPYIYGARQKIHVINLDHTLPMFQKALQFAAKIAEKKGKILFVGTKYAARAIIKEEAVRAGMPYVNHRWLGGMLTNYKTIRQSIKRLKELDSQFEKGDAFTKMTKKEILNLTREKDKLAASLEGIKNMGSLPDAIFVIDVGQEKIAVQEANRLAIPVIGIVDTNCNPTNIDYVIPGNDDALRAIRFYCKSMADVILEARGAPLLAPEEEAALIEKEEKVIVKKIGPKKKAEKATQAKPAVAETETEPKAAPESETKKKVAKPRKPSEEKKSGEQKILKKPESATSAPKKVKKAAPGEGNGKEKE